jgi:hypothetical protein
LVLVGLPRRLKTHGLPLVSAVELPETFIRADVAAELVDAVWKASNVIINNTIIAYGTYTNKIGGLEPVRIGWRTQVVPCTELSTEM